MGLTKITGQVFNLIMKIFFFLLGFIIILCSCMAKPPLHPPKPIVYPDLELPIKDTSTDDFSIQILNSNEKVLYEAPVIRKKDEE